MRVSYRFTEEDLWHYNLLYLGRRAVSGRYFLERSLMVVGLFLCFGVILRLVFGSTGGILRLLLEAVIVGLVCYVLMLSLSRWRVARGASRQDHLFGEYTVEVAPEGINYWAPSGSGSSPWETIRDIAADERCISFFFGKMAAVTVPKRAFHSQQEADDFLETARAFWGRSTDRWREAEAQGPQPHG